MTKHERFVITGYTRNFALKPGEEKEFYAYVERLCGWKIKNRYELTNNRLWEQLHIILEPEFMKIVLEGED
ncbi:MAG: hypothetical protein J6O00_10525 [Clostridiales bacterium]|nr:hypothetical protein [Clostridiales bacterium]